MIYKLFVLFLSLGLSTSLFAQQIAITMDGPQTNNSPLMSGKAIDKSILSALNKHQLKIILFVEGKKLESKAGQALLKRWEAAEHVFGNHTYSHRNLNEVPEQGDEADTLRNEKILLSYSNFKRIFRFPFLKEGDTAEKRDAFRAFLKAHHYVNGSVTVDASDWYINDRLEAMLIKNPNIDLNAYKKYYLDHVWNRAQYYDKLAKQVLGHSPKHTLLMHHNLLNALFLDDLIQMFKDKGWKVINAVDAFNDPVFSKNPKTVPAGESLIWALAKETGKFEDKLRYPGEDEEYEKGKMDKLGL
jgi:peptidoglycan/xylan/chitin deacetylase (PgdA/CDA1 family)